MKKSKDASARLSVPYWLTDMTLSEDATFDLHGREKELRELFLQLSKGENNSTLILGHAGVGKTTLVRNMANLLFQSRTGETHPLLDLVPPQLKEGRVYEVNLNIFLSSRDPREKLKDLLESIENSGQNIILFIDEIHVLMKPEHRELLEALKSKLAQVKGGKGPHGTLTIIGATNDEETVRNLLSDTAWARRFATIGLEEVKGDALLKICRSRFSETAVSQEALEEVVLLKPYLRPGMSDPDASLSILADLVAWHQMERGEGAVNKDILYRYLLSTYREDAAYWRQLIGALKGKSYKIYRPRELGIFEGLVFKISSLFAWLFFGEEKKPPQIAVYEKYVFPGHDPVPQRQGFSQQPVSPKRAVAPPSMDDMRAMAEQALPGLPIGLLARFVR